LPLNVDYLQALLVDPVEFMVDERDAILYALSIGLGCDPMDETELRFVYEKHLRTFPTMPMVMGLSTAWLEDPRTGITWTKVVHAAERLSIFRPLSIGTRVRTTTRITNIVDKGERGATFVVERTLRTVGADEPIATCESTTFCRADGGFGSYSRTSRSSEPVPEREPDHVVSVRVPSQAALLYRLNGDRNPLHADPEYARQAGFERPILHGLGTLGIASVAVWRQWPALQFTGIETRFASAVYPGETLAIDLWQVDAEIAFRVRVPARATTVLDRGRVTMSSR
jgi:acyl dehydratase